jgi:diguanylate cyclase (GGDEF)-like protein
MSDVDILALQAGIKELETALDQERSLVTELRREIRELKQYLEGADLEIRTLNDLIETARHVHREESTRLMDEIEAQRERDAREAEALRKAAIMDRDRHWQERQRERDRVHPLTGLLNAQEFDLALKEAEGDPRRQILALDLDAFKEVNDQIGHRKGNEALVHFAHQLELVSVRAGEGYTNIFHLQGDHFAGIFGQGQAEQVLQWLKEDLAKLPFGDVFIGVTGGIADTYEEAERAMNRQKEIDSPSLRRAARRGTDQTGPDHRPSTA